METFKSKRLWIQHTSLEEANTVLEENRMGKVDDFFAGLTQEQLAVLAQNIDSITAFHTRLATTYNANKQIFKAFEGEEMIGYVIVAVLEEHISEIQIELIPAHRGNGYGYELLAATLQYIFSKDKAHLVYYNVMPTNYVSIALAEKVGAIRIPPRNAVEEILLQTYCVNLSCFQQRASS